MQTEKERECFLGTIQSWITNLELVFPTKPRCKRHFCSEAVCRTNQLNLYRSKYKRHCALLFCFWWLGFRKSVQEAQSFGTELIYLQAYCVNSVTSYWCQRKIMLNLISSLVPNVNSLTCPERISLLITQMSHLFCDTQYVKCFNQSLY